MTRKEIESRLTALEQEVDLHHDKLKKPEAVGPNPIAWWTVAGGAGRFADDPGFEEMCRLGREYRKSLAPVPRINKRKKLAAKNNAHP